MTEGGLGKQMRSVAQHAEIEQVAVTLHDASLRSGVALRLRWKVDKGVAFPPVARKQRP